VEIHVFCFFYKRKEVNFITHVSFLYKKKELNFILKFKKYFEDTHNL